ncbi:hypothetical protein CUMW_251450, partial [Citrus unshiu]
MEALDKILKRLQCNYDHPQPQSFLTSEGQLLKSGNGARLGNKDKGEQDCGNEKVFSESLNSGLDGSPCYCQESPHVRSCGSFHQPEPEPVVMDNSVIHVIRLRIFSSLFRQLPEFSLLARNLYGDKDTGKDSEIEAVGGKFIWSVDNDEQKGGQDLKEALNFKKHAIVLFLSCTLLLLGDSVAKTLLTSGAVESEPFEAGQDMKMRSSCGRYCTVTEPKENETISRRSWQLASEWRALDKISVIAMQLPIILSLQLLINFYSIGGLMSLKGRGRARLVEMEGPIGYLAAVFSALGQNSGFVRSENL